MISIERMIRSFVGRQRCRNRAPGARLPPAGSAECETDPPAAPAVPLHAHLKVQPAPVSAHDFHLGVSREPIHCRFYRTLSDHLDNVVLLQVDDNCPVRLSLAPAPVVAPDEADPAWTRLAARVQLPQDRIVAGRDRKRATNISSGRPPAV